MNATTPEPRKRTRLAKNNNGPAAVAPAVNDGPNDAPDIVRLRAVLSMSAEGRTQREIARHFGKDERTIRRWATEAQRRQVAILRNYDAEGELAKALYHLNDEFAFAMRTRRIAEETGNLKLALKANQQCQRITETRLAILTKFGLFDGFQLGSNSADNPHEAGAALIAGAAHGALFGGNDNETDDTRVTAEEGSDELL
jgi:transposase